MPPHLQEQRALADPAIGMLGAGGNEAAWQWRTFGPGPSEQSQLAFYQDLQGRLFHQEQMRRQAEMAAAAAAQNAAAIPVLDPTGDRESVEGDLQGLPLSELTRWLLTAPERMETGEPGSNAEHLPLSWLLELPDVAKSRSAVSPETPAAPLRRAPTESVKSPVQPVSPPRPAAQAAARVPPQPSPPPAVAPTSAQPRRRWGLRWLTVFLVLCLMVAGSVAAWRVTSQRYALGHFDELVCSTNLPEWHRLTLHSPPVLAATGGSSSSSIHCRFAAINQSRLDWGNSTLWHGLDQEPLQRVGSTPDGEMVFVRALKRGSHTVRIVLQQDGIAVREGRLLIRVS